MDSFTTAKPPEDGEAAKPKGKGGRPRDPDKIVFVTVGMRQAGWDYLALFGIESSNTPNNPTTQLGNLIERTRLMMPLGPNQFGHKSSKPPKKRLPHQAISKYAAEQGISKEEAIIKAWQFFQEAEKRHTQQPGVPPLRNEEED